MKLGMDENSGPRDDQEQPKLQVLVHVHVLGETPGGGKSGDSPSYGNR